MAENIVQKILGAHLESGEMTAGKAIGLRVDQTLLTDATGTVALLEFETMGLDAVRTNPSVTYVDHATLETDSATADGQRFLQTASARYGLFFSRAGNGVCHQVHLERFGVPGAVLLGADLHTPTAGALGMIGLAVGGLDVAVAMAGEPYVLAMPRVIRVELTGKPKPWVSARDAGLELLRRIRIGKITDAVLEFWGAGLAAFTVPERAALAVLAVEAGVRSVVFPSDRVTREFLALQKRKACWTLLEADRDATYAETLEIRLDRLEPLAARPPSADRVESVQKLSKVEARQVCIGGCGSSSFRDIAVVAGMLRGKTVHPDVNLVVAPGSRQVLEALAQSGALSDLVAAGARVTEPSCGFCLGAGHVPGSGQVSVRTSHGVSPATSGTVDAQVYLVSAETAAATALKGVLTDPRKLGSRPPRVTMPKAFPVDDRMILAPPRGTGKLKIERGPGIAPLLLRGPLPDTLSNKVVLKLGDDVLTDHVIPGGGAYLSLRSNLKALAAHAFEVAEVNFARRAQDLGGGFIVGGHRFGSGPPREEAASTLAVLGVQFVLAKSFDRNYRASLISFGILPLTFVTERDFDVVDQDDWFEIRDVAWHFNRDERLPLRNHSKSMQFEVDYDFSDREKEMLLAGGLLPFVSRKAKEEPAKPSRRRGRPPKEPKQEAGSGPKPRTRKKA